MSVAEVGTLGVGPGGRVCVVGLGYIGFPTAVFLAAAGHTVLGVDVQKSVVDAVNAGIRPIEEEGLADLFHTALSEGRLRASLKPEPADAFFICVPTPSRPSARFAGRKADLEYVRSAAQALAQVLRPGNVVVLESTVPPGTTSGFLRGILEASGLRAHRDGLAEAGCFYLAHCPERVIPGRIAHELVNNDRVVGGLSREAAVRAADLYASFVEGRITLTDATTAEMVKLMENTFRDVNIALANEFALVCEEVGVDVWEAIALANRHPRVFIHRPGPGVGGHCIPVDPWFIVERSPETAALIRQARAVNDGMPAHVVDRAAGLLPRGRGTVALLGLSYKPDVGDLRESPSLAVLVGLAAKGIKVRAHDPFVATGSILPSLHGEGGPAPEVVAVASSPAEAAEGADLVLCLVGHRLYRELDPAELVRTVRRPVLFDASGALDRATWEEAGFAVHVLGRPPVTGASFPRAAVGRADGTAG